MTNDWTNSVDRDMVKFTKNQGLIGLTGYLPNERLLIGNKVSDLVLVPKGNEHGDCYLIARKSNGDAYGMVYVPDYRRYGPDIMVGVRLRGHTDVKWHGPYTKAEAETFREFQLFSDLDKLDAKKTTMETLGHRDVTAIQVTYSLPGEYYETCDVQPITIPLGEMFKMARVKK